MIPPFDPATGYLPPGEHDATWAEVVATYGYIPYRQLLLHGLRAALDNLAAARCIRVYLDGSFVTTKVTPGDFDMCFDPVGMDLALVDPMLLIMGPSRRLLQRAKYRGEIFSSTAIADLNGTLYVDYFQTDAARRAKGILVLDPRDNGGKP